MQYHYMKHVLTLIKGDITTLSCDAIVNAANSTLLGGGGVDGAIHKKGGRKILEACKKIGGCATGDAKITVAGNLPCLYVIHTVGPIYSGTLRDEILLKSCYIESLKIAFQYDLKSIAFPCISTGVYGYPKKLASKVAVQTVLHFLSQKSESKHIYFCVFDDEQFDIYESTIKENLR